MQTDTYGQLVDRLIIANLKYYHYDRDGNVEAAALAKEQADSLSKALETYDWECRNKKRLPLIQHHLRFHNHNDVEAFRAGKKATPNTPDTIGDCIAALVTCHSDYWHNQTSLQTLKKLIDSAPEGTADQAHFEKEFVLAQRLTDRHNQYRNELTEAIDGLYVALIKDDDE